MTIHSTYDGLKYFHLLSGLFIDHSCLGRLVQTNATRLQ